MKFWGFLKLGVLFGDPHMKGDTILGSILASPNFWETSICIQKGMAS